ncbi:MULTISPECIES: polysaccharide deacetylase family protein [Kitasatospora]|uniref:Polysaccharide deacetylase family protein n=1 Tax=Kitasatospora cathayae TaxID=3004092 RepID=A0ABY7QC49_9ACTN|nr:polysaccharide deacetylase family protein [Kitasatospora sp. HUAS 3-15]WBP90343.1 polysaccharide deacetylase family protein [Kitasatospora sp. HUAS 3-15]
MRIGTSLKRLCTAATVGVVLLAIPTAASAATPDVVTETATGAGSQSFALTIDDGPSPTWTPQVLDVLKAHGVHATFCMIGDHAAAYPDLVQRIAAEGHRLCNHTMHHINLTTQSPDQQRADIQAASDAIHAAVPGANIDYFRAPEGAWTADATQYAAQQGMQPIGWSVDTEDWRTPGVDTIFQNYKRQFSGGGVILMHDGSQENDRSQSVAAMDQILSDLANNNFTDDVPAVR